jgi:hypothetical protein
MNELHGAVLGVLQQWTIADLAARPLPDDALRGEVDCKMGCVCRGIEASA